jgi:ABC-2 type transport system ATP-binding protein
MRVKLRAEGLTKTFGDLVAVDHLDFALDSGEVWGFIGPNGAGKTTTLRMLATVDQPTAGDAWLDGCSVVNDADRVRPLLGFMPDFFGSYPDMLVSEYLDFFARAYGLKGSARRRRVADLVDFVELGALMEKRVTALSKGMRQRISLARALVHDPQVLLLDEPAAGLDPQARRDLRELLRLLAQEDKTIFISSHILAELEDLVDKVLIIHEGRVVYSGAPEADLRDRVGDFTLNLKLLPTGETGAAFLDEGAKALFEAPSVRQVYVVEPDTLQVQMTGGKEQIAEAVERLVARGIVPYSVMTDGRMLETVFLEYTRRQADAE